MRLTLCLGLGILLLLNGCAGQPPAPAQPPAPVATPRVAPAAETEAVVAEVERLRAAFLQEVPQHTDRSGATDDAWVARARAASAGLPLDHPQLLVVVDRNPAVQELVIVLAQPNGPWQVIGGSKVSTGQSGRRGYFITPTGVFFHTDGILDYRAEGTFNENHIRGLGLKGMRVWDFGWQTADTGWLVQPEPAEIRLLIHATDPANLEHRIGRAASKGCIRVPATMNRFLDFHGVLDADYEQDAPNEARVRAVLLPNRQPTTLAGTALVVIDTAQPG